MAERRYDEDEIREILARATELQPEPAEVGGYLVPADPSPPRRYGLTLAELEAIGREAGILPERISEAASELEAARTKSDGEEGHFGVPLTVRHVAQLPRMLTDDEWDRFVVRLRDTFGATGTVTTEGSLQTWTDGHRKVLLEPLQDGARLRLEALDQASKALVEGGVSLVGSGGVLGATFAFLGPMSGKPLPLFLFVGMLGLVVAGAGMWSVGRARAGGERHVRRQQLRLLGEEARRLAG